MRRCYRGPPETLSIRAPVVRRTNEAASPAAQGGRPVQYLVLIYTEEPAEAPDPAQMGAVMEEYNAYTQMLRDTGKYVAGEALQPTATATTVRIRDGQTLTTDGPFAETKEALGGFYLIECASKQEALDWAKKNPLSADSVVEVRPVWQM
jgi:hypothetical protein